MSSNVLLASICVQQYSHQTLYYHILNTHNTTIVIQITFRVYTGISIKCISYNIQKVLHMIIWPMLNDCQYLMPNRLPMHIPKHIPYLGGNILNKDRITVWYYCITSIYECQMRYDSPNVVHLALISFLAANTRGSRTGCLKLESTKDVWPMF